MALVHDPRAMEAAMKCFAIFVCAVNLLAGTSDAGTSTSLPNGVRARRIAQRIIEMQKTVGFNSEIEIRVHRGSVCVLGEVEDLENARLALEATLAEPSINSIELACTTRSHSASNTAGSLTTWQREDVARRIVQKIIESQEADGEKEVDLEIRMSSDTCQIRGSIDDVEDARVVLEAILADPNMKQIRGIALALNVGSEAPPWRRVPLRTFYGSRIRVFDWDERYWQEMLKPRD